MIRLFCLQIWRISVHPTLKIRRYNIAPKMAKRICEINNPAVYCCTLLKIWYMRAKRIRGSGRIVNVYFGQIRDGGRALKLCQFLCHCKFYVKFHSFAIHIQQNSRNIRRRTFPWTSSRLLPSSSSWQFLWASRTVVGNVFSVVILLWQ